MHREMYIRHYMKMDISHHPKRLLDLLKRGVEDDNWSHRMRKEIRSNLLWWAQDIIEICEWKQKEYEETINRLEEQIKIKNATIKTTERMYNKLRKRLDDFLKHLGF